MPSTPTYGLPYQGLGDPPNGPDLGRLLAEATEAQLARIDAAIFPVYATTTARDSAIPSPTFGRRASVSGTGEHYVHNGSAWISATPRTAIKTVSEDVTSSTSLQDDDHLFFPVEANCRYVISGQIWVAAVSATPKLKFSFSLPAGATIDWDAIGLDATASNPSWSPILAMSSAGSVRTGNTSGAGPFQHILRATAKTAGTAGTVRLQWTQNASGAAAARLAENSYLQCWKVT